MKENREKKWKENSWAKTTQRSRNSTEIYVKQVHFDSGPLSAVGIYIYMYRERTKIKATRRRQAGAAGRWFSRNLSATSGHSSPYDTAVFHASRALILNSQTIKISRSHVRLCIYYIPCRVYIIRHYRGPLCNTLMKTTSAASTWPLCACEVKLLFGSP